MTKAYLAHVQAMFVYQMQTYTSRLFLYFVPDSRFKSLRLFIFYKFSEIDLSSNTVFKRSFKSLISYDIWMFVFH